MPRARTVDWAVVQRGALQRGNILGSKETAMRDAVNRV